VATNIDKEKLAYFAGLFDGEGCVSASIGGCLQVTVGNTVIKPLTLGQKLFGGSVNGYSRKNRKVCYTWRLCAKNGSNFLQCILPYLLIKDKQAILGIKFVLASYHSNERESIIDDLHKLNGNRGTISRDNLFKMMERKDANER